MLRLFLMFFFCLVFCASVHAQGRRAALVIGNSAYQHTPALANPKNDAEDVAAALQALGFEVTKGLDLDKAGMDRTIRAFAGKLAGVDLGLFFYAGHGLQVGGVNYLVPIDAQLTTAAALDFEMVRLDLVQRTMESETKTSVIMLDACRDNPLSRNLARALGTRSATIGRGLAQAEAGVGTLISYSTQPGNVALDGTGRNSPYAGSLVRHIKTAGEDLTSILIRVRNDVIAATGSKQVPWDQHALRERLYLGPRPAHLQSPMSEAAQAWVATKDSTRISDFLSYADKYRNTVYAELAQARIRELSSASIRVWNFIHVDEDCRVNDVPGVEVLRQPLLGRIGMERREAAVTQPLGGNSTKCQGAKGEGIAVSYDPRPGAAMGIDSVSFKVTYGSRIWVHDFEIDLAARQSRRVQVTQVDSAAPLREQTTQTALVAPSRSDTTKSAACDGINVDVAAGQSPCIKPGSGKSSWFKDCPTCPEMVVVPAGRFTMGSPTSEAGRSDNEDQVSVTIAAPFAVGKFAVTFDEWEVCVTDGGCNGYRPEDRGWGRGKRPVINVNWNDAKAYAAWLSQKTGKTYRLLSESEREYVARAGTTTPFWWGASISTRQANYDGNYTYGDGAKGEYRQRTMPVDSFDANPWGLYNVHGNVWEWTEDCYASRNGGNPGNGRARSGDASCSRVLRGGSWYDFPGFLRAAQRIISTPVYRYYDIGFRLARTLPPSP